MEVQKQQISPHYGRRAASPILAAAVSLIQSGCAFASKTVVEDTVVDDIASEQISPSETRKTVEQHVIRADRAIRAGQTFLNRGDYGAAIYWFNAGLVEIRDAIAWNRRKNRPNEESRDLKQLEVAGYIGFGETLFIVAELVRQGRCEKNMCEGFIHDATRLAIVAEAFLREGIARRGGQPTFRAIEILTKLCHQYTDLWTMNYPDSPAIQSCLKQPK